MLIAASGLVTDGRTDKAGYGEREGNMKESTTLGKTQTFRSDSAAQTAANAGVERFAAFGKGGAPCRLWGRQKDIPLYGPPHITPLECGLRAGLPNKTRRRVKIDAMVLRRPRPPMVVGELHRKTRPAAVTQREDEGK